MTCPRCGELFAPLVDGKPAFARQDVPRLPARPDGQRETRAAGLASRNTRLHDELRQRLDESAYTMWIKPLRLVDFADNTLFLLGPAVTANPSWSAGWVRGRYGRLISEVASALANRQVRVEVVTADRDTERLLEIEAGGVA